MMRQYTYQDVTNAGWITPDHGFNTTTLTMVVVLAAVILIIAIVKDI